MTTAINGHEAYNIIIESLKKKEESDHQHHMLFDIVLLDLNMPISDGFEACQKILKLYDKDSIFKIEKKSSLNINDIKRPRPLLSNNVSYSKSKGSIISQIPNKLLKPLMIACSSEVYTEDLKQKLDMAGFTKFFEVPLKA